MGKQQKQAFLQSDGKIYFADEVTSSIRQQVWLCSDQDCRVPLTYKAGFHRRAPHSNKRVPVSAHWVRAHHSRLHVPGCKAGQNNDHTPRFSNRLGENYRTEDSILLQFGSKTPVMRSAADSFPGSGGHTEYVARAGTLHRLISIMENAGGYEAMKSYFFLHDGVEYHWPEIAYTSTPKEYRRLHEKFTGLMNPPKNWPWIIWGTIERITSSTNNRKQINIYPHLDTNASKKSVPKISCFYTPSREFEQLEKTMTPGAQIVFLMSQEIYDAEKFYGLLGSINQPEDVIIL